MFTLQLVVQTAWVFPYWRWWCSEFSSSWKPARLRAVSPLKEETTEASRKYTAAQLGGAFTVHLITVLQEDFLALTRQSHLMQKQLRKF